MEKSTKVFLIVLTVFIALSVMFRNVQLSESFAVYDSCTPQEIEMGCHADAVRTNWLGLVTPVSVLGTIITLLIFVIYRTIRHFKKR